MIRAEAAIGRVRRDLALSILLKLALGCAAAACLLIGSMEMQLAALLGIGSIWVWQFLNSAAGSKTAAASPSLIAAGQFEEAERNIEQTVRTFSLFRPVKLQALHHLALLRHAQRRWPESAALARALLRQRLGSLQPLSKPARLLLADSLLEMNDLRGAREALSGLYAQPLSLPETLNLLVVQTEYLARTGAWPELANGIMHKAMLAELMPAAVSARTQAMLALAARRVGRDDLARWLRDRAELLADVHKLTADRPLLKELWAEPGG